VAGLDTFGVTVSVDRGKHWQAQDQGLPGGSTVIDLAYDPAGKRLFGLAGSQGVFVATAGLPLRWRRWGEPLPPNLNPLSVAFWPRGQTVLVGDGGGSVLSAAQTGKWQSADAALPVNREAITRLALLGSTLYAGLTGGLWISRDAMHWVQDQRFGSAEVLDLTQLPSGGIAAATNSGGMELRGGQNGTWRMIGVRSLGLSASERVLALAFDARNARICLGSLSSGVVCVRQDGSDPRRLPGIPADDPINGMLLSNDVLAAATNSGMVRLTVPRWN